MELNKESKIHIIHQKILNENDNKYYTILNKIIVNHKLEHSSNTNGIFLNLTALDESIIDDIYYHFVNTEKQDEPIFEPVELKHNKIKRPILKTIEKDKLYLEKFDKYIIQVSKSNISI